MPERHVILDGHKMIIQDNASILDEERSEIPRDKVAAALKVIPVTLVLLVSTPDCLKFKLGEEQQLKLCDECGLSEYLVVPFHQQDNGALILPGEPGGYVNNWDSVIVECTIKEVVSTAS